MAGASADRVKLVGGLEGALRLLEHACALVSERSGWTQRTYARERQSRPVAIDSERAVRYCAGAAVIRAEVDVFRALLLVAVEGEGEGAAPPLLGAPRRVFWAIDSLGLAMHDEILAPRRSGQAKAAETTDTYGTPEPDSRPGLTSDKAQTQGDDVAPVAKDDTEDADRERAKQDPWASWRVVIETNDLEGVRQTEVVGSFQRAIEQIRRWLEMIGADDAGERGSRGSGEAS